RHKRICADARHANPEIGLHYEGKKSDAFSANGSCATSTVSHPWGTPQRTGPHKFAQSITTRCRSSPAAGAQTKTQKILASVTTCQPRRPNPENGFVYSHPCANRRMQKNAQSVRGLGWVGDGIEEAAQSLCVD
ncbi:MAG TPA: hypothetical protein VGL72_31890, partial [Bryobacteraceae bacterium]